MFVFLFFSASNCRSGSYFRAWLAISQAPFCTIFFHIAGYMSRSLSWAEGLGCFSLCLVVRFFVVISARYLPLRFDFGFWDSRYDVQSRADMSMWRRKYAARGRHECVSDLVVQTENHKRYYCYTYPLTYLPCSILSHPFFS